MPRNTDLNGPLSGVTARCGFSAYAEGASIRCGFSVDAEGTGVIVCGRHGNSAEYTIASSSSHDPEIIVCVFFQIGTAVFFDHCAAGCSLCRCGLVPVPCPFRIRGQKDVVSTASVDDLPGELFLKTGRRGTDIFLSMIFRGRGNICDVGPGAILPAR